MKLLNNCPLHDQRIYLINRVKCLTRCSEICIWFFGRLRRTGLMFHVYSQFSNLSILRGKWNGTSFNTCMKKDFFLRRKVNRKSNISSVWRGPPRVSRYMTTGYTRSPIHFSCKKGPIPVLIKKVLCVTREQLTFSGSDDDFEHSCIELLVLNHHPRIEKVNFSF